MLTVPAQIFWAPTRARLMAAARFMPGVCAVLTSREFAGITRTPCVFQSICSLISASLALWPDVSDAVQRLLDIVQNVVEVLQPDGEAQQPVADAVGGALL